MSSHIYLDHNATTPVLPEVADAVRDASLKYGANPGSQHGPGRLARRALEEARERVGELLGARQGGMDEDRILFTSGGTEAANLAIFGLLSNPNQPINQTQHLVTSAIEHPCILEAAKQLPNCEVESLKANSQGIVDVEQFRRTLRPDTQLVSVMLANNETGVLQPVAEISELCKAQGTFIHSDAAQAVGKIPVNFSELNLSAMSCTAHKFHGPLGIGVLVVRYDVPLRSTLFGGHQQGGLRPGTEMVALAIGLKTALECWQRNATENMARIGELRDQFERTICAELPAVQVIGGESERLPNTSNISFVGFNRQALMMALDQAGIACSSGSACASGSSEPSPVLVAMGLDLAVIEGSIRFSLGASTTATEIVQACRRILNVCQQLRRA